MLQTYDILKKELRDRGYYHPADEKLDLLDMIKDNPYYNTTRQYANLTSATTTDLRRAIKDTNRSQRQLQTVATVNNTPVINGDKIVSGPRQSHQQSRPRFE